MGVAWRTRRRRRGAGTRRRRSSPAATAPARARSRAATDGGPTRASARVRILNASALHRHVRRLPHRRRTRGRGPTDPSGRPATQTVSRRSPDLVSFPGRVRPGGKSRPARRRYGEGGPETDAGGRAGDPARDDRRAVTLGPTGAPRSGRYGSPGPGQRPARFPLRSPCGAACGRSPSRGGRRDGRGPRVPTWARVADQAPGVAPGHLLATLVVVAGVLLLGLAWGLLWRRHPGLSAPRPAPALAGWLAAWVAPLLLAAPFASQDVWTYGAEGKMVLDGFGGYRPASLLGHSVWTLGVDAQWAARPSLYGPGALDLSALFVKISGGRPWVAAECWRLTAVIGLLLCAWGVRRIVSLRGGNATTADLARGQPGGARSSSWAGSTTTPSCSGSTVAGMAVAMSGAPLCGILLCALGVAVKPNALLAVGALAWWAFGKPVAPADQGGLAATAAVVAVLVVCGLGVGRGIRMVRRARLRQRRARAVVPRRPLPRRRDGLAGGRPSRWRGWPGRAPGPGDATVAADGSSDSAGDWRRLA